MLKNRWEQSLFLCVGLDPQPLYMPPQYAIRPEDNSERIASSVVGFNRQIVEHVSELVCAFKINPAFYYSLGEAAYPAIHGTIDVIREFAPGVPIIYDAKFSDVTHTNYYYSRFAYKQLGVDSVTVNPYAGLDVLEPFVESAGTLTFVVVRTSNFGSNEFQHINNKLPVATFIAESIYERFDTTGRVGIVYGAQHASELCNLRKIIGPMPVLIPGVGYQGKEVHDVLPYAASQKKSHIIISASRSIIYSTTEKHFAEEARLRILGLNDHIQDLLK